MPMYMFLGSEDTLANPKDFLKLMNHLNMDKVKVLAGQAPAGDLERRVQEWLDLQK